LRDLAAAHAEEVLGIAGNLHLLVAVYAAQTSWLTAPRTYHLWKSGIWQTATRECVVHDEARSNDDAGGGGSSLLDAIVREGALQMMAAAPLAELSAQIEAHGDELDADGHRLVVRNGFHVPGGRW
jgi:hypothetical protein